MTDILMGRIAFGTSNAVRLPPDPSGSDKRVWIDQRQADLLSEATEALVHVTAVEDLNMAVAAALAHKLAVKEWNELHK